MISSAVCPAGVGGETAEIAAFAGFFDISCIMQSPRHNRYGSGLYLIQGESRDFQKLLKHFNATATPAA